MYKTPLVVAALTALLVVAILLLSMVARSPETPPILQTDQAAVADGQVAIPGFLARSFPDTDFSTAAPAVSGILSGGPGKDGIPALENPQFVPVSEFVGSPAVQAIVVQVGNDVKVYPYNILNWHEIVNDTVGGNPVSVTFCPLCGSAIVYDRRIDGVVTTLGVSGALIESNMVMYDRATESLWQQSTGEALAGVHIGATLELFPMQLTTVGEASEKYPHAVVLSQETGYVRDYDRNPYGSYDTDNQQFIFQPSEFSDALPAKEIMVVFKVNEQVVATQWNAFSDGEVQSYDIDGERIVLSKDDGELTVATGGGGIVPFYFEMWFSVSVQHGEDLLVI